MCRLFGMTAGDQRVHASFWLLDAPDSLQVQGRRNRDGTGLGFYDDGGNAIVDKQPEAAYSDVEFITEAKSAESTTFVAHVRVATTGLLNTENTHPFAMDGRIMAHNGGFEGLAELEAELGDDLNRVHGDTDSERYMALITKYTNRSGDVGAGIVEAATWISEHLPLFALNTIVITEHDLWALRYPDHHRLYALRRARGGHRVDELRARSDLMEVSSAKLVEHPSVVIASEPMDDHPDWRLMESGELLHVTRDLKVTSTMALPNPPKYRSIDPLPYVP